MNIIPPPLPPMKRHDIEYLTGVQAQKMVIHSISFSNNWRSPAPRAYSTQSVALQQSVQSMVALPGGEHIVAVVADKDHTSYGLEILVVDPRGGIIPVAKLLTETKPYNIQAKYMTIGGVSSIAIGYVRREFYGNIPPGYAVDPSLYEEESMNLPHPLRYECTAVSISLDSLEDLVELTSRGPAEFLRHASARPSPFTRISTIRSRSPLTALDLTVVVGVPYLAVVKHYETVVFKNLDNGSVSSLTISRWPHLSGIEHKIQKFRILPHHRELLLLVAIPELPPPNPDVPPPPHHQKQGSIHGHLVACVFSMPRDAEDVRDIQPHEYRILEQYGEFRNIEISDPAAPAQSIRPLHLQADIPHVSVYYENLAQLSAVELRVPPYRPYSAPHAPVPFFNEGSMSWESKHNVPGMYGRPDMPLHLNVHPGHSRPLLWTTPVDERVHPQLIDFISQIRELGAGEVRESSTPGKGSKNLPPIRIKQKSARKEQDADVQLPALFRRRIRGGIQSLAWDDWSGRIFLAIPEDCAIHVIDLAQNPI